MDMPGTAITEMVCYVLEKLWFRFRLLPTTLSIYISFRVVLLTEPFNYHNPCITTTLKITDFDEVKVHEDTTTLSLVGTCAYMAPEVLLRQRFSKASDVWRLVKSKLFLHTNES